MATVQQQAPGTVEEAVGALSSAAAEGLAVRFVGGATKLGWGRPVDAAALELRTGGLDRILEHNAGDLTAELEAGVPLSVAQREFARHRQRLALDPPLGDERRATIGGIIATGDSGPLRHRYGAPRDLILGARVVLSDGTVARSGSRVIKNVAGYDLAKLMCGSFGTLGLILSVNVRLHPVPESTVTALGSCADPEVLAQGARALAAAPLELEALDVAWHDGRGGLLAQCAGHQARRRALRAAGLIEETGLQDADVSEEDEGLWERQRAGQRSRGGALVRIAARPTALPSVLRAVDRCGGTLVGRAALGSSYVELEPDSVPALRDALGEARVIVLDAPAELRARLDPWGDSDPVVLELMRRVKARFDPSRTCNPGLFVGGI